MTAHKASQAGNAMRRRALTRSGVALALGISLSVATSCNGGSAVATDPGTSDSTLPSGGTGGATAASTTSATTAARTTVATGGGPDVVINLGIGGAGKETTAPTTKADPNENRVVEKECAATSATATDVRTVQPADIVFAIDGSSSMAVETQFVMDQMNQFSQKIMDSGIDVRVIVLAAKGAADGTLSGTGGTSAGTGGATSGRRNTTPGGFTRILTGVCIGAPLGSGQCPDDQNLPNYAHVTTPVDSNDSLNVFVNSYPEWKDYLRAEASKSLVVVTDDDALATPNNSAAAFTKNFSALDPTLLEKWTFNGVFCFTQCAEAANIGKVYADLVAQTSGVSGDLCEQNFEPVFNRLAEQIIQESGSKLECEWALPERSDDQTFSPTMVQVTRSDSNGSVALERVATAEQCDDGGWHFDSNLNPTKILACESTCKDAQNSEKGKVEIVFGCESVNSCAATDSSSLTTGDNCSWALPKPPSGQELVYSTVNVRYTSASGFATDLGQVDAAADCEKVEEGWYYDNPDKPKNVVACPQTCTQIKAGGDQSKLEVLFGCATAKAPPITNI